MTNKKRWFLTICAFVVLNSVALFWIYQASGAGRPTNIRIMSLYPEREIDSADRIGLLFDVPIVGAASVGKAVDFEPYRIEPNPPGKWVWAAADRLEYLLEKPLHAGTAFHIHPNEAFSIRTGLHLVGESEFTFSTRSLAVASCDLESSDESNLNIRIRFNQAVDPQSFLSALKVREAENNGPLESSCLTRETSEELIVRLARPHSGRARLTIGASLTGSGGELALGHPFVHDIAVDAPFIIERADTTPATFEMLQEVRLDFSRQLKADQPKPAIRFDPPVEQTRADFSWDEIHVRGAFACGRRYKATISAGLLDHDGKPLEKDQTISFTMPDRNEAMRFPIRRGILSPNGNLLLDLQLVNCSDVKLSVSKLHENNLVAHLRGDDADATSREILERDFKIESPHNQPTTLAVKLGDLLKQPLGVYQIAARSERDYWTRANAVIAITDLGITCKRERNGIFVWVTSLRTAEPASGVNLKALSFNNQLIAAETTGDDGCARLPIPEKNPDGPPYVVVAERAGDVNYCLMDERLWVPDEIDLAGRTPTAAHDVMLYPERGVYRPGDTIHLSGIIRTADGATPPAFPLWIRTRRPDGRETGAESVVPRPENQGLFHVDIHTREDAQLGPYRFTATLPGSDEPLGETKALVEAFLPIRLELTAEPDKPRFDRVNPPTINISGSYLFGKPASGVKVAITGNYREKRFEAKNYPAFRFGPIVANAEARITETTGALDEQGRLTLQVNAPKSKMPTLWQGRSVVTLTEAGSRSVSKSVDLLFEGATRHLGLALPIGAIVAADTNIEVQWAQLDPDERPAEPLEFELKLERIEHDWVFQERNGDTTWKSVERRIPVGKKQMLNTIKAEPIGSTQVAVTDPGEYLLTAIEPASGMAAEFKFRAVDPAEGGNWALSPHPDSVDLEIKNPPLTPGAMADCIVQAPFAGQLLLTIEDQFVRESRVVEMKNSPAEFQIAVPPDLRGDAFVTATLIRPIDPSREKWLPNAARGITRLNITPKRHVLPVEIIGPDTMGSEACTTFAVRAAPPADPAHPPVVHLWAVDDGILMTTAFKSPDPLDYYFSPRALTVESTDLFASLMPDTLRPASMRRIGADADGDGLADLQRSPVATPRREPAVVWLASRPTDGDGYAAFNIQMPELSGRMRVMAVAVDGDRYGHAARNVTVTSPLLAEAGWPRFLAPGDRCRVPVKLFNNTDETLNVTLTATTTGGAVIELPDVPTVDVTPTTPNLVWLQLTAGDLGPAGVELWAQAESSNATVTAHTKGTFPVRPATALDTETVIHRLIAGEKLSIDPPTGFLADTTFTDIEIGASRDLELQPAIEDLLEYPYGCVEQTSSRLWALVEAGRFVKDRVEEDSRYGRIDDMIRAGITRLWSMQTPSGGLSYWPGSTSPDLWGSTYAAGVLARAHAAGCKIDTRFKNDLLDYLDRSLADANQKDENTRALICEALASFDRPNAGWMARLSEKADQLDLGGRAALARAWFQTGEKDRARSALPKELPQLVALRTTGGRITSDISQIATLVGTLRMIDPDSPWIPQLIERLRRASVAGKWSNTLENATAVAALAADRAEPKTPPDFQGTLVGADGSIHFDETQTLHHRERSFHRPIDIQTTGAGELFVVSKSIGLRALDSLKDFDRGLNVRRRWLNADRSPIATDTFNVGDLITVEITLSAPELNKGDAIENIAIVDALPAGFEIENPRLAGSADTEEPAARPDQVQFLDDRVLIFASARRQAQTFRYHLRAVTAGAFVVPPLEGSCMYDSTLASLQTAGRIEVRP